MGTDPGAPMRIGFTRKKKDASPVFSKHESHGILKEDV